MNPIVRAATAALFVAALAGVSLLAGCGHRSRGHGPMDESRVEEHVKKHVDRLLSKMDATDEQRQKVYALRDRLMPDLQALVKARDADKKEFIELWNQPTFDAAKLNALVDQRVDQFRTTGHNLANATAEFHAILTPEQREKLAQMCRKGGW
ncbi:MAG: Spy/CpxP family protein refolding chaperone [Deltaproteobacteria bacterium]|nr:Spy/CpxP family protein refolding chaperone [Deltaproteobacteria bacterium]